MSLSDYIKLYAHIMPVAGAPYSIYDLGEVLEGPGGKYNLHVLSGVTEKEDYIDTAFISREGRLILSDQIQSSFKYSTGRLLRKEDKKSIGSVRMPEALQSFSGSMDLLKAFAKVNNVELMGFLGSDAALVSGGDAYSVASLRSIMPYTGCIRMLLPAYNTDSVINIKKSGSYSLTSEESSSESSDSGPEDDEGDIYTQHMQNMQGCIYSLGKSFPLKLLDPLSKDMKKGIGQSRLKVFENIQLDISRMVLIPLSPDKERAMVTFMQALML